MTLTERDESILEMLTLRVRLLSASQIAAGWWPESSNPASRARGRLGQLIAADLVQRQTINARPLLDLAGPVVQWQPADQDPDYHAVSYRLQSRWTQAPAASRCTSPR